MARARPLREIRRVPDSGVLAFDAWRERVRASLFFVPLLYLLAGLLLGEVTVWFDEQLADDNRELAFTLTSTVDGARAILTTVATATVTVAGIAFSVSLLVFQLASSQFSPRAIHGLFRDPFNKRVIGVVVGTFAFCLMVLRSTRGAVGANGEATVPAVSVALALLLGLVSLLAIVAFIDHSAHTMEISELLQRITDDGRKQTDSQRRSRAISNLSDAPQATLPPGPGFVVTSVRDGWIQQIDTSRLLQATPVRSTVRLDTTAGRYVIEGSRLCTVWPSPPPEKEERVREEVRSSVRIGRTRTMQQDAGYGVRQLADVAVMALSPGVNDPTTAQDAIFHLAAVMQSVLRLPQPVPVRDDDGRTLFRPEDDSHRSAVAEAYDEIRRDAASRPAVCVYLLESLHLLVETLGPDSEFDDARAALRDQAALVVAGCEQSDVLAVDRAVVRAAYEKRFGAKVGLDGASAREAPRVIRHGTEQ
jgi:uncharacterized membrane protein